MPRNNRAKNNGAGFRVAEGKKLNPGDEAVRGTAGTGEDVCPECNGSGRVDKAPCPNCGGRGTIVRGVRGA
jgi:DnaJ-class molecular chaperone